MTRLLLMLVLAVSAATAAARPQAPAERGAAKIQIDAVAVDKKGVPVIDLKAEELEVWIGHFRVPIDDFTVVTPASDQSRLIVLVLDHVTMPLSYAGRGKEAARRFVNRMLP